MAETMPMSDVSGLGISAGIGGLLGGFFTWLSQRLKSASDVKVVVIEQWEKLAGALEERCQRLEEAEERCRRELADAQRRLSALEGYEHGQGKARQEAAQIVAIERLESRKQDGDK